MNTVKTYKGHTVPDGATGFIPKTDIYTAMFVKDGFFMRVGCSSWVVDTNPSVNGIIEGLPQEPEQYTPNVGEWCEWRGKSGGFWVKAKVSAIELDTFVFWQDENSGYRPNKFEIMDFSSVNVRPIKTEREKVIGAALGGVSGVLETPEVLLFINQLYDAGMLTMPENDK